MRNSQHLKHTILSGLKGVNNDATPELYAQLQGVMYDLINGRIDPDSIGEVIPVGGEESSRTPIVRTGGTLSQLELKYVVDVDGMIVSLWNYTVSGNVYGAIAVDLVEVASSTDLVFGSIISCDFSKIHHRLFIADGDGLPLILDIDDMVTSVGTDKYFADFVRSSYSITFNSELTPPRFLILQDIGSGSGMKCGAYIYMYRLVDEGGDRTGWSMPSVTIPVVGNDDRLPRVLDSSHTEVMGWKTYGGNPGDDSKYGVRLRIHIVNTSGFKYVELGRFSYIAGGPIGDIASFGVTPLLSSADGTTVDITQSIVSTVEFIDSSKVVWENSSDFLMSQLSKINSVDTIRYFADRLVMGGIRYADTDFSNTFTLSEFFKDDDGTSYNSDSIFPVLAPIGRSGHKSVYNQTYFKSYMHRDVRSLGIIFDDGAGGYSQAIPLVNFLELPHASEPMSNASSKFTDYLHRKLYGVTPVYDELVSSTLNPGITGRTYSLWNDYSCIPCLNTKVYSLSNAGYDPYRPTGRSDNDVLSYTYRHSGDIVGYRDTSKAYAVNKSQISGYFPKYFSLGLALAGINFTNLPSWVKGFSIVQTEQDNRVLAQGIAMYNLTPIFNTTTDKPKKLLDSVSVHFSDLDRSIGIYPGIIDDLISNPQNYQLQLMDPVGFFSEGYSPKNFVDGVVDGDLEEKGSGGPVATNTERDLLTFANVKRPSKTNPYDSSSAVSIVQFGKYRLASLTNPISDKYDSNTPRNSYIFNITNVSIKESYGENYSNNRIRQLDSRTTVLDLTLDDNIYSTNDVFVGYTMDSNFTEHRAFHEPWYIVNLIRKSEGVSNANVTKYSSIGHHQRLSTTVGVGNGGALVVKLVTNRINDILYVDGKAWYLVPYYKDWTTLSIYTTLITNASTFATDINRAVFGIARWRLDEYGSYEVYFEEAPVGGVPSSRTIPAEGSIIEMRYNSYSPIELFGGDHVVSENICAYVDMQYNQGVSTSKTPITKYTTRFHIGFPLPIYRFNTKYRDVFYYVRQWIIQYVALTRTNIPFISGDSYPNRNYMLKPADKAFHKDISEGRDLDTLYNKQAYTDMLNEAGIDLRYLEDYEDQFPYIGYGGFVIPQTTNIDYSKKYSSSHYTLPLVGFTAITYFPNRVVWSMTDNGITQDTPGLKTVLASAVYDTKSEYGSIIRMFHFRDTLGAGADRANDLYIVAESGVCRLMTSRALLSTVDDNTLAVLPKEGTFIQREDWVDGSHGIEQGNQYLAVEKPDSLYYLSDDDIYTLTVEGIKPIGMGYHKKVLAMVNAAKVAGVTKWAAWFRKYGEVIFLVDGTAIVYNHKLGVWVGSRDYTDSMLAVDNSNGILYGYSPVYSRIIADKYDATAVPKQMEITFIVADAPNMDKEFVDVNVISGSRPDIVEFSTSVDSPNTSSVHIDAPTTNNLLYMKQYGKGWWTYIPVIRTSRLRQQGNYLLVTIKRTTAIKDFIFKLAEIGWKLIK